MVLWLWNEAVTLGRKGTADHDRRESESLERGVAAVQAAQVPIWSAEPVPLLVKSIGRILSPVHRSRACRITSRP